MVGTALSGTVSSATAQGYLPQYRGSAAASLAPAMTNVTASERDADQSPAKAQTSKGNSISFTAVNSLPENRPLLDCPQGAITQSTDNMGAEGYMRFLTEKDEKNKKIIEENTGPVMGSW